MTAIARNRTANRSHLQALMRRSLGVALVFVAAICISLFTYRATLHAGFASDDLTVWNQLSRGKPFNLFTYGSLGAQFYRPIVPAFLYTFQALFGSNPFVFHVVVAVLHGLAAGMLFFCAREARSLFGGRSGGSWVAGAMAAVMFLTLRTHAEAINWLSAIGDVLSTTLGLLALYCFLRFQNQRDAIIAAENEPEAPVHWKSALLSLLPRTFAAKVVWIVAVVLAIPFLTSVADLRYYLVFVPIIVVSRLLPAGSRMLVRSLLIFGLALFTKESAIGLLLVVLAFEWVRLPSLAVPSGVLGAIWLAIGWVANGKPSVVPITIVALGVLSYVLWLQRPDRRVWAGIDALRIFRPIALLYVGQPGEPPPEGGSKSARWRGHVAEVLRERRGLRAELRSLTVHFGPALCFVSLFIGYWSMRATMLQLRGKVGGWGDYHTRFDFGWLSKTVPLHFNNAAFGFPTEWPFGALTVGILLALLAGLLLKWRLAKPPIPAMALLGVPLTLLCLAPGMPLPVYFSGENARFAYLPSAFFALGLGSVIAYLLPELVALAVGVAIAVPHYLALQVENPHWKAASDIVQGVYASLESLGCTKARKLFVLTSVDFRAGKRSIEGVPQLFKASFRDGFAFHFPNSTTQVGVGQLVLYHRPGDRIRVRQVGPNLFRVRSVAEFKPAKEGAFQESQYLTVSGEGNGMYDGRSTREVAILELLDYDPVRDAVVYIDGEGLVPVHVPAFGE